MDSLFIDGKFLGIRWTEWKIIGWVGNIAFFSRFLIQWHASEKQKRVVVPVSFWWLSLIGSLCLLTYALVYRKDSVFIFAYAFNWIPYFRNLIIHQRSMAQSNCPACATPVLATAKFCNECGAALKSGAQK